MSLRRRATFPYRTIAQNDPRRRMVDTNVTARNENYV